MATGNEPVKNNLILATSYALWGFFPLYWQQLQHIKAHEVLFHRILWSFVFFAIIYFFLTFKSAVKNKKSFNPFRKLGPKNIISLILSSAFITTNWFLYIYAVNTHQVLQGSIAYYISPLLSIILGSLFYHEKMNVAVKWAFGFCCLGVFYLLLKTNEIPYLALVLALTFSGYGFIKKRIKIHAIESSLIESSFLIIPCIYLAFFSPFQSMSSFTFLDWFYLLLGGAITGIPIVLFSYSAQKVPLTTIGFFQYISPTLQFLSATLFLNETLTPAKLIAFIFIWIGAGIYLYSLAKNKIR